MFRHFNILIFGNVQAVGFRQAAKEKAEGLSILGFVKNLNDGSVYIEAEGSGDNLEKFIKWCKRGPFFARVKRVEVALGDCSKYEDFSIL